GAGEGAADVLLDHLRRRLADQHAVVAPDVVDDPFVELVAADANAALVDHAAERDDADFRRAATDVDDHRAAGFAHRQAGADRRGHRLLDEIDLRGSGTERRFADGAALDLGRSAGHADDDPRARPEHRAWMDHLDELLQHLLGDGEVGDDAVLHRPDGFDVAGHLAEHRLGLGADGLDGLLAVGTAFMADGHDGRLVEHDAFATHVDQRVGGAEVDGQVRRKIATKGSEHGLESDGVGRGVDRFRAKCKRCRRALRSGDEGCELTGDNNSCFPVFRAPEVRVLPLAATLSAIAFPAMALTSSDVRRIAELARLDLDAGETARMLEQLNAFFRIVEQRRAVDTSGVEPLYTPLAAIGDAHLRLRDDVVTEGDD